MCPICLMWQNQFYISEISFVLFLDFHLINSFKIETKIYYSSRMNMCCWGWSSDPLKMAMVWGSRHRGGLWPIEKWGRRMMWRKKKLWNVREVPKQWFWWSIYFIKREDFTNMWEAVGFELDDFLHKISGDFTFISIRQNFKNKTVKILS